MIQRPRGKEFKVKGLFYYYYFICVCLCVLTASELCTLRKEVSEGNPANFKFQIISPETTGRRKLVYCGNF